MAAKLGNCRKLDGGSVTWYEPTPVKTTLNPAEVLTPGKLQVNEGSSATLNWNYSLTSSLVSVLLQFNGDGIVVISSNGQAGLVSSNFRQRFSVSSTPQSVSLLISKVTTADDKSIGEFSCELTDLGAHKWRRAIQVQVTDPTKIVDFQHEYMVGLQQSLTLNCEAEGNPPPTYTWTPCDPEQVCDKNTLHISQVLNDANFTFRVANVYRDDSKTASVYIGGNVINITIVITSETCIDGKYNQSLLLEKLKKPLEEAFADKPGYEGVQLIGVRCGSIIVDLALKFNSSAKEQDVIITLNDTVKDGKLGELSVGAIKGKTPDVKPTGGGATSPLDRSHGAMEKGIVVRAVFGSFAALAIAGILVWWTCRKKRRNRKGTEEKASESERKDLLSELELMKQLKPHRYVIKLLGCVTKSEPLFVLIEYVPFGDLLGYMRKSRGLNDTYYKDPDIKPQTNLTSQQLIKFAWQIADGMSYLSSIPVIHRDLAARNVLVGEDVTCKVTDFGMVRDVQEDNIYERKTGGVSL